MRLIAVDRKPSLETAGCVRIEAHIECANGRKIYFWIDVPSALEDGLSEGGNPWLAAMLPIAASLGENITLDLPVDSLLLENVHGILAQWHDWYPDLKGVKIECPVKPFEVQPKGKVGAFFSGGVDSYFTVARRLPEINVGVPPVGRIDDLITVWGFDVGVQDRKQFEPLAARLAQKASLLGLNHLILRTNLRQPQTVFRNRWGPLTHGTGLAVVGLALERRFDEVVLGSSDAYGSLVPWGSHPLIDPLFSSFRTRIVHDGASYQRFAKTAVVSRLPASLVALHVCQAQLDRNCSVCEKCYRTMTALDILGAKERFELQFDWSKYSLHYVSQVLIIGSSEEYWNELAMAAAEYGRHDVADALAQARSRSRVFVPLATAGNVLRQVPLLWRVSGWIDGFLERHSVTPRYVRHAGGASGSREGLVDGDSMH